MPAKRVVLPLASLAVVLAAGSLWLGFTADRHAGTGGCASGEPHRRVELVFGLSRKGRPDVTGEEWRQFLDREVTPRFPD
ncbi:MAG: DUF3574 domain-containing protein, partial [Proteobacteria bacterium]|nr:DUF3574 domain-containing protein [Pseudomonadota bacterium]